METEEGSMEAQEAVLVAVQMKCQNATLCAYAYAMTCGITAHVNTLKEEWETSFCSTSTDL